MPTYAYRCPSCDTSFDRKLPIAQYKDVQYCPTCNAEAIKMITPTNFNLPGDDFPGKNNRIRNQMRAKNDVLDKRQEERRFYQPTPSLVPNFNGQETSSWKEAGHLAKKEGYDPKPFEAKEASLKSLSGK